MLSFPNFLRHSFSLHTHSVWETICDARARWSGWKFGSKIPVYPILGLGSQNTPPKIYVHFPEYPSPQIYVHFPEYPPKIYVHFSEYPPPQNICTFSRIPPKIYVHFPEYPSPHIAFRVAPHAHWGTMGNLSYISCECIIPWPDTEVNALQFPVLQSFTRIKSTEFGVKVRITKFSIFGGWGVFWGTWNLESERKNKVFNWGVFWGTWNLDLGKKNNVFNFGGGVFLGTWNLDLGKKNKVFNLGGYSGEHEIWT